MENSPFSLEEQGNREPSVEVTATRAHYFRRNDKNEVSYEALDAYERWMLSDALAVDDAVARAGMVELIIKAAQEGRDLNNPEMGFSLLFRVEIDCIEGGYLAPKELQEQTN